MTESTPYVEIQNTAHTINGAPSNQTQRRDASTASSAEAGFSVWVMCLLSPHVTLSDTTTLVLCIPYAGHMLPLESRLSRLKRLSSATTPGRHIQQHQHPPGACSATDTNTLMKRSHRQGVSRLARVNIVLTQFSLSPSPLFSITRAPTRC